MHHHPCQNDHLWQRDPNPLPCFCCCENQRLAVSISTPPIPSGCCEWSIRDWLASGFRRQQGRFRTNLAIFNLVLSDWRYTEWRCFPSRRYCRVLATSIVPIILWPSSRPSHAKEARHDPKEETPSLLCFPVFHHSKRMSSIIYCASEFETTTHNRNHHYNRSLRRVQQPTAKELLLAS